MNPIEFRYEVTTYVPGSEVEAKSLSAAELKAIDVQTFDHLLDTAQGVYGYRRADGKWAEQLIDGSGLGKKTGLNIVMALQLNPGVFLTPAEIALLVNNDTLKHAGPLAARMRAIRVAHGENGADQRFFISRRDGGYALKWPREFSWIWIDRI